MESRVSASKWIDLRKVDVANIVLRLKSKMDQICGQGLTAVGHSSSPSPLHEPASKQTRFDVFNSEIWRYMQGRLFDQTAARRLKPLSLRTDPNAATKIDDDILLEQFSQGLLEPEDDDSLLLDTNEFVADNCMLLSQCSQENFEEDVTWAEEYFDVFDVFDDHVNSFARECSSAPFDDVLDW